FFFQAEVGIRDRNVTGVQTCALPILQMDENTWMGGLENIELCSDDPIQTNPRSLTKLFKSLLRVDVADAEGSRTHHERNLTPEEIGRASCREWKWIAAVEVD